MVGEMQEFEQRNREELEKAELNGVTAGGSEFRWQEGLRSDEEARAAAERETQIRMPNKLKRAEKKTSRSGNRLWNLVIKYNGPQSRSQR